MTAMAMDSLDAARSLAEALGPDNVRADERTARYTTWRVGGPARLLCVAADAGRLRRAVEIARTSSLPWLVLGRGSNVLFDDAGVDGIVIVNRATGLEIRGVEVRAESGVLLSVLARETVGRGLVGLEWCHDIPGSVGGAVVNNAGANGGSIAGVLTHARILPPDGPARAVDVAALAFGYRRSALRAEEAHVAADRPVVLDAMFTLMQGETSDVKGRLAAFRLRRKQTQPGGASAGSTFKNPPGDSAGRLVESVGLKGARIGDASISTLHANFIVNGPRATAADILSLIGLARRRVYETHGILLEPEVQFVYRDGRIGPPPLGAEEVEA